MQLVKDQPVLWAYSPNGDKSRVLPVVARVITQTQKRVRIRIFSDAGKKWVIRTVGKNKLHPINDESLKILEAAEKENPWKS